MVVRDGTVIGGDTWSSGGVDSLDAFTDDGDASGDTPDDIAP